LYESESLKRRATEGAGAYKHCPHTLGNRGVFADGPMPSGQIHFLGAYFSHGSDAWLLSGVMGFRGNTARAVIERSNPRSEASKRTFHGFPSDTRKLRCLRASYVVPPTNPVMGLCTQGSHPDFGVAPPRSVTRPVSVLRAHAAFDHTTQGSSIKPCGVARE
jgi:hypothetical protein